MKFFPSKLAESNCQNGEQRKGMNNGNCASAKSPWLADAMFDGKICAVAFTLECRHI